MDANEDILIFPWELSLIDTIQDESRNVVTAACDEENIKYESRLIENRSEESVVANKMATMV